MTDLSVIERLWALSRPINAYDGDAWEYVEWDHRLEHIGRVLPIGGYKVVAIERIRELGAGFSLRHIWRRVQGALVEALSMQCDEMQWFKEAS